MRGSTQQRFPVVDNAYYISLPNVPPYPTKLRRADRRGAHSYKLIGRHEIPPVEPGTPPP